MTGKTVLALMLREMSTRYGRSPGGYIWAILEPLGAIIMLGFGFSLLLRNPSLGNSFLLFYATGFLPFSLYQNLSTTIARSMIFSKPLLRYPAVIWIDAILARLLLNSLTGILVTYIVLTGILFLIDTRTVIEYVPLLEALFLTILLGFGIGVLNCALFGLIAIWETVWSIITRPLFLASGIFFIYEDMPPVVQDILWYNPLLHLTGLMRQGFYPMYAPQYINLTYVAAFSLIALFFGLLLLSRHHRDILNR